jgi:hypothetical protein
LSARTIPNLTEDIALKKYELLGAPSGAYADSPYTPLDSHNVEIRLATVAPGNFNDPLVVRLSIVSLSTSEVTQYETLS